MNRSTSTRTVHAGTYLDQILAEGQLGKNIGNDRSYTRTDMISIREGRVFLHLHRPRIKANRTKRSPSEPVPARFLRKDCDEKRLISIFLSRRLSEMQSEFKILLPSESFPHV